MKFKVFERLRDTVEKSYVIDRSAIGLFELILNTVFDDNDGSFFFNNTALYVTVTIS